MTDINLTGTETGRFICTKENKSNEPKLSPTNLPFPEVIDATMMRDFRSCEHKFFLGRMLGLQPVAPSIHLHAGKVFARGMEVFRLAFYGEKPDFNYAMGRSLVAMIREWGDMDIWEDHNKSLWNIILGVRASFLEYPPAMDYIKPWMGKDGKTPAVEFNFVVPIPGTRHPVTGNPLLYTGRFDMLADYQKLLYIEDDKTASALGASWTRQWLLRSQFIGYAWGAKEYGLPVAGAIIRGTAFLKTKFTFLQVIQQISQWEIDRWLEQTRQDLLRMERCWESGVFGFNLDESCAHYGGCTYLNLCTKPNPENWIEPDYKVDFWKPLEQTKAELKK